MPMIDDLKKDPVKWIALRTGDLKLTNTEKCYYEKLMEFFNSSSKITLIQSPRNKYLSEIMDKKGD